MTLVEIMLGLFGVVMRAQRGLLWLLAWIVRKDLVEVGMVVDDDDGVCWWCDLGVVLATAVTDGGHACV